MRYRNFSSWLRERYGAPVGKICIDGGFTCPNRDGTCGTGGCAFCGERGAGEHINGSLSISAQVKEHLEKPGNKTNFIAYFQNFSGTYAPPDVLRARYAEALCDERIVALAVGTRPDCIDEGVAGVLSSFTGKVDVWVELGLQTANDDTARRVGRGYPRATFERAVEILRAHNIPIVVHIMVGLPGEAPADALATVKYLSRFDLFGIKIHSTYVTAGTRLGDDFLAGRYTPLERQVYLETVAALIAACPPRFVIHRLTGDPPENDFLAPEWARDKNSFLRDLQIFLDKNNIIQGQNAPKGEEHE